MDTKTMYFLYLYYFRIFDFCPRLKYAVGAYNFRCINSTKQFTIKYCSWVVEQFRNSSGRLLLIHNILGVECRTSRFAFPSRTKNRIV